LRVLESLLVSAFGIVSDELEKERNVFASAFVADALDEGVLFFIDVFGIEWRVVDEDLDAVRAGSFQSPHRPEVKKIRDASRSRIVVSRLLVGKQQSSFLIALLGCRQSKLGIQQDCARVLSEHFGDDGFEVLE